MTRPTQYQTGSWTSTLPSAPVSCNVHLPNLGDSSGTLDVSVHGDNSSEIQLSDTAATDFPVSIPAAAGWYDIDAQSAYSGGVSGEAHYQFGLNDGAPTSNVALLEGLNPTGFEDLATSSSSDPGTAGQTSAGDQIDGTGTVSASAATGVTVTSQAQTTTDPDTGVTSTIPASSIAVQLPYAAQASGAVIEAPGITSYDNGNGSKTVNRPGFHARRFVGGVVGWRAG